MNIRTFPLRIFRTTLAIYIVGFSSSTPSRCRKFLMKIPEPSPASPHSGEKQSPQAVAGSIAAKEKLSLSAIVAGGFGEFGVALRARLLGRLLASVGPLALKVVGGGVFAKYVRYARSPEMRVSFDDAAHATSSQVSDLVHYVEQSDPHLVEELSTALSPNDVTIASARTSIGHGDQLPLETQKPNRRAVSQETWTNEVPSMSHLATRTESEEPRPGLRFRRRDLRDY
jgi:hypothetical protein